MKKPLLLSVMFILGTITLLAQNPKGFNYQAIIRNAQGEVVANTDIGMRISLLQGSLVGNAVYVETFGTRTNNFGLVNLVISNGTVVSGDFETIDWSTANYYIKVELDASNTGTYSDMGTTQLLSVPYANYAFSGVTGKSAYETWLESGNTGTEQEFIDSLAGPQGEPGADGKSAYESWLAMGNTGTEEVFIDSLVGEQGEPGISAYQIWLSVGNTGTESDFISSLTGPQGIQGLSAYEVWLSLGNTGTESDFINSLTGPAGTTSWTDSATSVTTHKKVGVGTASPTSIFQVVAPENHNPSVPLFEVKNSSGKTVFAIYENEVKVFLDKDSTGGFSVNTRDTNGVIEELLVVNPQQTVIYVDSSSTKATRGGFAVSGRTSTKGTPIELLSINTGLTEFFVDQTSAKATRGGFAVSGRTSTKGTFEMMNITPDFTRFYVDTLNSKATRGGFAVSGRTSTKQTGDEILMVSPGLTEVFVNESLAKATRGGFAVSGRTSTKVGETYDILHVQPQSTDIYIKPNPVAKSGYDGFTISGYNQSLSPIQLFAVSEQGTVVNTTLSVAPKLSTYDVTGITQTTAKSGGAVTDSNNVEIIAVGIIYSQSGDLNIGIDFTNPAIAGKINGNPLFATDFTGLLMENLQPGVSYQVRSFATNKDGLTGYGPVKTFTTAIK